MDAGSRALAIPELLEAILIHLPAKDLFLSQRVARLWGHTVLQSLRLRQALFLQSVSPGTCWMIGCVENDVEDPASCQFFALESLPLLQTTAEFVKTESLDDIRKNYCFKTKLNDMVIQRGHWTPLTLTRRIQGGEAVQLSMPKCAVLGTGLQMYLTEPPCTRLMLWPNWGRAIDVERSEGIRFGDILREIERTTAAPIPYMPHFFMLLSNSICLTDEDDKEVAESIERWKKMYEETSETKEDLVGHEIPAS